MELLDGRLGAFQAEIVAWKLGAHLEPKACGALESFNKEDHIASSYHFGSEVGYVPCFQGIRSHDWVVVEVLRALIKELPDIIGCVTDRLVVGFGGRTLVVQMNDRMVGVTQEQ